MMPPRFHKKAALTSQQPVSAKMVDGQTQKHLLRRAALSDAFPAKLAALDVREKNKPLDVKEAHANPRPFKGGYLHFSSPVEDTHQTHVDWISPSREVTERPVEALIPTPAVMLVGSPSLLSSLDTGRCDGFNQTEPIQHNTEAPPGRAIKKDEKPASLSISARSSQVSAQPAHYLPPFQSAKAKASEGGQGKVPGNAKEPIAVLALATHLAPAKMLSGADSDTALPRMWLEERAEPPQNLAMAAPLPEQRAASAALEASGSVAKPVAEYGEVCLAHLQQMSSPAKATGLSLRPASPPNTSHDVKMELSEEWTSEATIVQAIPHKLQKLDAWLGPSTRVANVALRPNEAATPTLPPETELKNRDGVARPQDETVMNHSDGGAEKPNGQDDKIARDLASRHETSMADAPIAKLETQIVPSRSPAAQVSLALSNGGLLPLRRASAATTVPGGEIPGHGSRPVRSLTLQLTPADLGAVTLTVKLRQKSIELRLETESEATLKLLQRDETVLHEVLRSAGYNSDTASLQIVLKPAADVGPSATIQTPSPQNPVGSPQQPPSAFDSQPGSTHSGQRRGFSHSQPPQSGNSNHDDGAPLAGDRSASGIFV